MKLDRIALAFFVGATCVGIACGNTSGNDVPAVAYKGSLPATANARYLSNVLTISASANGATAQTTLVDTGSPMTGVDPSSWADAHLSPDLSVLGSLTFGALTFQNVPSVALSECGAGCGPYDVTGLVGGNVLRSFVVAFDYQAPAVTLGPTAVPARANGTPIVLPFTVQGGGNGTVAGGDGQVIDVPATRIVLQATLDGKARTLVLDTGASYTLLRQSLFDAAVADGRTKLAIEAATVSGAENGSVTRTHTLDVGAASSAGSPMASVPDSQVDDVASETGTAIDGMLGGSFLRAYYTVIDYGAGKLSLYPYATPDPLADEFVRVGLFLVGSDGGYDVFQATDPAAQPLTGATLVDVDGTMVAGLDPEQADRLLRGQAGSTHTLHVAQGNAVSAVTLTVKDILPLSP